MLDENLYWLTHKESDWLGLEALEPAAIQVTTTSTEEGSLMATLRNTGAETAFFMRLKIVRKAGGELVLPVYMEDNYITLFPGERRQIGIDLSPLKMEIKSSELQLEIAPWNGESVAVSL